MTDNQTPVQTPSLTTEEDFFTCKTCGAQWHRPPTGMGASPCCIAQAQADSAEWDVTLYVQDTDHDTTAPALVGRIYRVTHRDPGTAATLAIQAADPADLAGSKGTTLKIHVCEAGLLTFGDIDD